MTISIFELFSIGVGPSSSHTVGPMRAAKAFIQLLEQQKISLDKVSQVKVDLYGSLALTGKGHGTDVAIINGLEGQDPETVDPAALHPRVQMIAMEKKLALGGRQSIYFNEPEHLLFHQKELLPLHSNGLRFSAYDAHNHLLSSQVYYSIGGGFIVTEENFNKNTCTQSVPYPFESAEELLTNCKKNNLRIPELMLANECVWEPESVVKERVLKIARTMEECIQRGCRNEGTLPGFLKVKRRAPLLYQQLISKGKPNPQSQGEVMNWVNTFAMAVNEENAAGGRVVTAPTNGAAGIIPAVLEYYKTFCPHAHEAGILEFLLTAGAIAILYKKGASISGAEVGCQGEVGTASSMAAGALTAVLGGTLAQIENAAEIAMEHHLGMTCDPIGGLVQIPCIERNAMGALKAINACQLSLMGDGSHYVSLDKVIKTMLQTGKDMMSIYKETSQGGLAVNITEC